jgi:hypothetical protein
MKRTDSYILQFIFKDQKASLDSDVALIRAMLGGLSIEETKKGNKADDIGLITRGLKLLAK